jgi:hypothetical protein
LQARAEHLGERIAALVPLIRQLLPLLDRLPAARHADVAVALGALEAHAAATTATPLPWADVAALLRPFVATGLTTLADVRAALAVLPPQQEPEQPRVVAQSAGADDARYVENAGLCLLWPFLARFFARLSLLTETETMFVSGSARHRAVGLLHYVASGERDAPGAWLVLNKVLCGLEPDDIARFDDPVTEAEAGEADAHAGSRNRPCRRAWYRHDRRVSRQLPAAPWRAVDPRRRLAAARRETPGRRAD